jgi:glycosyltransferase involved in cell wall biosynthesis
MASFKRTLFIMPVLFCGGSEKQIRFLIEGLYKKGYPISVLVESSLKEMANDEQAFVQSHPEISFLFLNSSVAVTKDKGVLVKYAMKIASMLRMLRLLRNEIREKRVEQVMVTNLTGLMLLFFFKFYKCDVIYNERNPGDAVTSFFWRRFLLKRCGKLVCNSKAASKIMSQRLRLPVPVINNGVELQEFSPSTYCEGPYRIIVPARISKIKNQKVILEAVNQLQKELDLHVVFAGAVEDQRYYEELQNFVSACGLEKNVEFIGFASNLKEYYRVSHLLILASLEEGTPNVLLEAYMQGVPVLASNIPMNADCVLREELLFSPDSPEELAQRIRQSKERSVENTLEILKENRTFVQKSYSEERMVEDYVKILYN